MSHPGGGPEFLATYGDWSLDGFLRCLEAEPTVLALVTVETDQSDDASREITNDLIHDVWDKTVSALPACAGHRLSWNAVLFLIPEGLLGLATVVFSDASSRGTSHTVEHWFSRRAATAEERRCAIRELEDAREHDHARTS